MTRTRLFTNPFHGFTSGASPEATVPLRFHRVAVAKPVRIHSWLKTSVLFCGLLVAAWAGKPVFLFTYFVGNGADGLHLLWSEDGYRWEPIAEGRSVLPPRVAIVNQALAEKMWPGENPIGQRITQRWGEPLEVIGVVPTGKYVMVGESPRPAFWLPFAQSYNAPVTLLVRTRGEPEAMLPRLRAALGRLDDDLPIYNAMTMEEHLRSSALGFMPMRMAALMAGGQGLIGLLLAVMGVYGVVAYSVNQRTREIGIRLALGAERSDVFRLVVRGGLNLIVVGLGVGLLIAVGLAVVLSGLLVGLSAFDLPVFGGVAVGLTAISLLACYLPARRAMSVDPVVTLKCE